MKDSETYARKVKKLLSGSAPKEVGAAPEDPIALMVHAVFEENTTPRMAEKAVAELGGEFVDFNEFRVSPIKDICECVGRTYPNVRDKAVGITRALHRVFQRVNALSVDYLAKKPKREVRRRLREDLGLSPYAESVLTLIGFGGHAIPVDELLLDALKHDRMIHPDSDVSDLQGFLVRIIPGKNALAAHHALRAYAAKAAPAVHRQWARRERLRKAAEAKAKAEAEAKAKAEAEAKAKAEAEAEAKAKAKKRAARKKAQAARKKKAKTAVKKTKAVRKKTKTTTKKPAAGKTAQKAGKKAARKRK